MSRRSLTRKIEERFRQATEDLKALLANVQSVATTADVWSCRNRLFGDEVIDNSHNEANEAESGEQSGNEMYVLPQHQRCAAHNLNLVATSDAEKAMTSSSSYKKIYRSAFAKARELWNKQCRSTQAADVIKMELGKMLVVPTATRWNSVYDSVTCLVTVYDKKTTELNRVCNILKIPLFTLCDMSLLKEYILVLKPVAVSLDILQGEEKAFMGLLVPAVCVR
ncbi:hypothetical protein HAZT_HAZT005998 [Hyalella azteca]|uniref:HAT C-terminal dimerisation domain-containing protein n=1 Tax=Hyalella azteca TaxID=294128 RepID=A0A6A0GZM4_HYAAZ|nr:hypothetical protein HAZT_HAZT005998 [Hyalella azteca]